MDSHQANNSKLPFVSSLRLGVLLSTSICILAVDFRVFPRKWAKTSTYGVSPMDACVGMFIYINALVSSEARKKTPASSFAGKLMYAFRSNLPALLLGLGRLMLIRTFDYHQPVSEFGVHWNFFITLFFAKTMSSILFTIIPVNLSGILMILITCLYQHLLTNCGLQDYILNEPDGTGSRIGLISANREGLFSSIGFTAIYMGGVYIGQWLFIKKWTFSGSLHLLGYLCLFTVLFSCVFYQLTPYTGIVSRRLANTTYVVWILAQGSFSLTTFLLIDIFLAWQQGITAKDADMFSNLNHLTNQSSILRAVNAHQAVFFLLSNFSTGLVNLTINTLAVDTITSFLILVVYMFLLCGLAVILFNIKLKI